MSAFSISQADLLRVCRDLAWSEIAAMPGLAGKLGPRLQPEHPVDWSAEGLALDSLARMQLATAAATWCNAYDAGFEDLFLAKRSAADWAAVMARARASGAAHFTFSSSGSTGVRKHIRHREDVLASEAHAWAKVLTSADAGPPVRRVVVLAPTHHIYGFIWGVLLPLALGVPVIDADFAALAPLLPGDLLIAVPDQWQWLATSVRAWPEQVQGISSTAPLPDAVHSRLIEPLASGTAAPLSRLLQIYGSSETAGLAWRADPTHPYTLAPGRTRTENDGIELLLPSGAVAAMPVQDKLQWVCTTAFNLLRRVDNSVQVGGHNVSPDWVAQQLMTHSAVKAASVRLDTLATPPRLKAFVVLHAPGGTEQKQAFQEWALGALPHYATLANVTYGEALPLNAMGKPSDWQNDSAT